MVAYRQHQAGIRSRLDKRGAISGNETFQRDRQAICLNCSPLPHGLLDFLGLE
ncbi:hypothetical protein DIKCMJMK_02135 [Shewanella oneidensis]|nr:hypothetical protein [Shewanella oneidensis]